ARTRLAAPEEDGDPGKRQRDEEARRRRRQVLRRDEPRRIFPAHPHGAPADSPRRPAPPGGRNCWAKPSRTPGMSITVKGAPATKPAAAAPIAAPSLASRPGGGRSLTSHAATAARSAAPH